MSAQQRLYISFIGRSIQDNSLRYPSVLVTELLEYTEQSYCLPGDEELSADASARRVGEHLLKWHARMPFAAENFLPGSAEQSYAAEWLPAADGRGASHPAFNQPLPVEALQQISLDELLRFYRHPIRAFSNCGWASVLSRKRPSCPTKNPSRWITSAATSSTASC